MNREEEFKKQLQELLNGKDFPFEEKDWISAKKVIDENRRKRRGLPFILLFSGLALGTLGLLFWPDQDLRYAQTFSKTGGSVSTQEKAEPQLIPSETPAEKNHSKNIPETRTKADQALPVTGRLERAVNRQKAQAEQNLQSVDAGVHNQDKANTVEEYSSAPVSEEIVSPVNGDNLDVPQGLTAAKDSLLPAPVPESSASGTKADSLPEQLLAKIKAEAKPTVDSVSALPAADVALTPDFRKKLLITAEAGFNVLGGWNSAAGTEGRRINPVLGINYHGQLSDKLECSAGFHLTTIMGLYAFSDTSKVTRYGFGEESEVTVITPKTLLYLNFPLRILWNFNLKQAAGLNLEPGYLINSVSHVEQYTESTQTSSSQFHSETGYTQGFSNFNLQIGFFYRQRLFERFYLQPEVFIGLKDLKDNAFFNSETTERSSGLKLTLLYTLLRR